MRPSSLILLALLLAGLWVLLRRRRASSRTERLEKEKDYALGRLRESERHLGALVEEAREYAVCQMDPEGRILSWNPGAERLLGSRAEEVLGRAFALFFPVDEVRSGRPDRNLAAARDQGSFREEAWLVKQDGSQLRASLLLTATRSASGQATGFMGVVRDLTERLDQEARLLALARGQEARVAARTAEVQESEARIQGFIRHAPVAIAVKGLDGRLLLVNRRAEALIGMFQGATPDGSGGRIFTPEHAAQAREQDELVLTRRMELQVEESVKLQDGSTRALLVQKFPLLDALGHCWGLGIIATNITERKLCEQAELQRQKLDAIGLLAGGIAHEFNNLLGAMAGNVELARLELGPLEHLGTLEALIERASGLVSQVLAYAGLGRTRVQPVDLNLEVEDLSKALRASLAGKAALRWEPGAALPPVEGDPAQIRQVIVNLVMNACEALEGQGGTITLRTGTERVDEAGQEGPCQGLVLQPGLHVTLVVADDGPGMREEVRERIFEPFYTTKFAGRGLGLSAARGILRSHHGGITVASAEGRGTTFKLLFPASVAGVPDAEPEPEEEAIPFKASGAVLVVDDEEAVRTVAVRALRGMGFETLEAGDGLEALLVFEAHWDRIRLVLMDLTMPRMGGEETYRELRRAGAMAPIILTSGFSQEEALQRFRGMALAGFLQKPYRLQALGRAVRDALVGLNVTAGLRGDPPRELVTWLPEFELGHPLLDAQHKGLVRAYNHLVAATEGEEGGKGNPARAFAVFLEALAGHFSLEERILDGTAYCRAEEHKAAHAAMLAAFQDLAARIGRGEAAFTPAVFSVLEDGLLNHIQLEGMELARHLQPRESA